MTGEKFHVMAGKWEGDFYEIKHHTFCWSLYEAMCCWLRTNAGLRDDEMPGFGELLDATAMEKHENDGVMPAWWPAGLPFTKKDLRETATAGDLGVAA